MRFQKLTSPAALLLTAVVLYHCPKITGQVLEPIQSRQFNASVVTQKGNVTEPPGLTEFDENRPYKISSRIHLQKGASTGYLIVKMELPKGSYIYSLTQKAPLRPSKIKVAGSKQFRLKAGFTPDRPAKVIEKDPVFEQRLEKHTEVVQFFAPVEIASGVIHKELIAEITFSGQVCNDQGFCVPIMNAKTKGKFAGYFQRTAEKRSNSQTKWAIGK